MRGKAAAPKGSTCGFNFFQSILALKCAFVNSKIKKKPKFLPKLCRPRRAGLDN